MRQKQLEEIYLIIDKLKVKLNADEKKNRLEKGSKENKATLITRFKIKQMAKDSTKKKEFVTNTLFGEVMKVQLSKNYSKKKIQ